MSVVVTIKPGGLYRKGVSEERVVKWDWDSENLADTVLITTSTWEITVVEGNKPIGSWSDPEVSELENPPALTNDEPSIPGGRTTQTRLKSGTLGHKYRLLNRIVTNETPAQTKARSCFVSLEER